MAGTNYNNLLTAGLTIFHQLDEQLFLRAPVETLKAPSKRDTCTYSAEVEQWVSFHLLNNSMVAGYKKEEVGAHRDRN